MPDRQPRRGNGLSGVPINSYEVAEFDALRATGPGSDFRVLIECWVGIALLFALAFWDGSTRLGSVCVIAVPFLLWWTSLKVRSSRRARRLMRRAALEPRPSGPPPAASDAQGWCPDPAGRHEQRWFSSGTPTRLVRDGAAESQDPYETQAADD